MFAVDQTPASGDPGVMTVKPTSDSNMLVVNWPLPRAGAKARNRACVDKGRIRFNLITRNYFITTRVPTSMGKPQSIELA